MHKASALIERAKRLIYDSPYCVYYLDHSLTHMTPEHTYNIIYLTSAEINKTVILFASYLQWHDVENLVVYILILALFFNFLWRFSQFRFWVDCEFFVCVWGKIDWCSLNIFPLVFESNCIISCSCIFIRLALWFSRFSNTFFIVHKFVFYYFFFFSQQQKQVPWHPVSMARKGKNV